MGNAADRGKKLEERVEACLRRLELLDFADNIQRNLRALDRGGIQRQIDLEFTLKVAFVEIRVSIECKSRSRAISMREIDQIIQYRASIPHRNIFWFVIDGEISTNAATTLVTYGITVYDISDLEKVVEDISILCDEGRLDSLRGTTALLSVCDPHACYYAAEKQREFEVSAIMLLKGFSREVLKLNRPANKFEDGNLLLKSSTVVKRFPQ